MSVYVVPWSASNNLLEESRRLYDKAGTFNCIEKGDLVAVKLHVGELGNPYYVQPLFVHDIVNKIREIGGKPFLTDSNTYYNANRNNAYDHMINALMNGYNMAPFIVADGLRGESCRMAKTKGILKEIEVADAIADADSMIVLSHCKGHELSGFGGALKNLGMGCAAKAGKLRQHRTVGLEIDESKCTGCGKCKEACEMNIPDIVGTIAKNTSPLCMRCPFCSSACPRSAIKLVSQNNICKAIPSAALGVLSTFKRGKVSYVSFAKDITQYCDCRPNPGEISMKDIGIFASDSPVSIDSAFLKMAKYKIFNKAYRVDCKMQIKEAKKLGIDGDLEPRIIILE